MRLFEGGSEAYLDQRSLQEIQVKAVGNDAEVGPPGLAWNGIVKAGGNDFHGFLSAEGQSPTFQSDNVDAALRAQGVDPSGNGIKGYGDLSASFGGRIVRDRLWFYAAERWIRREASVMVSGQVFNLLNANVPTTVSYQSGPTFGRVSVITPPRIARFGTEFNFWPERRPRATPSCPTDILHASVAGIVLGLRSGSGTRSRSRTCGIHVCASTRRTPVLTTVLMNTRSKTAQEGEAMRHPARTVSTIGLAIVTLCCGLGIARAQQNPYRLVENWAQVPPGFAWGELADADLDAQGNLWVLHRPPTPGGTAWAAGSRKGGEVPVLMFDASRKLVKSFGQGMFLQPHGLHVDPDGNIWVTDSGPFYEAGKVEGKGFQVFKFNRDGKLLMTLGKAGVGVAGPDTFVGPTDVVVNARGEIFVADGHTPRPGSSDGDRIVKLSKDGKFIKAWGSPRGSGPGQVIGPHRLALDSQGRLFVADRGNRRIQIFDQDGRFLDQWTQFGNPSGIWIDKHDTMYVAVAGPDGGIRIGSAKTGSLTAVIRDTSPEVAIADSLGNVYSGLVGGQKLQQFVK